MANQLLLPNKYKMLGWCILIPSTIFGIISIGRGFDAMPLNTKTFAIIYEEFGVEPRHFAFIHTNVTPTIAGVLFIAGALLVGFSKEKREDEFIANLRLSSLLWAVLANYILLLISFVFVYGEPFFTVMVYNMFTVLAIFIIRFNYILYRNYKAVQNEK